MYGDANWQLSSCWHFNFRYAMQEIAFILDDAGSDSCGFWVAKKYFIGYVKHGMCLMRSIFCYFHGSMDSTRCCKHPSGRFGPCRLHSDAFILLSTHSTSSQRCSVWLRYEERRSYGRKTEVTVMSGRISQQCVHVKWHLPACIHLNSALWPYRPHPYTDPCTSARISQIALYFSALQSCGAGDGTHGLIFLFFADWSGKWQPSAAFSPSNSRLNDVCFLKCPSAHCCCTELSLICGLLNKFCHSLSPDFSHEPPGWWLWKQQVTSSAVCLNYHIPSIFWFFFFFWMHCPVKKKHSGIIFEGYLFELISGHLRGSGMYSFYSFDLSLTFNIRTINCKVKFKNPKTQFLSMQLSSITFGVSGVWRTDRFNFFLCTIRERGADVFSSGKH